MDNRFPTLVDDGGTGSSITSLPKVDITSPPKVDFATQSKEIVQQQTQNSPFVQAFVNTQNAISNQVATGSGNPGNTSPSVTFLGTGGQPVLPKNPEVSTLPFKFPLEAQAKIMGVDTTDLKTDEEKKVLLDETLTGKKIVDGSKTFTPGPDGYDVNTGLNKDGLTREQVLKAKGTDDSLIKPFSFMDQGRDAAQIQYDADALKAEQNALFARQEFMREAEQGQTQKDVQKYLDNQSAEKAGWTGGYRLDQDRQRQYLEATVQASMYNAQEMQKFGLESSLQAARLAYEQGKTALAMEYYKLELDRSMNEAQLTGIYFSPEQKDMLGQLRAAEDTYNNLTVSTEDKDRAGKIINSIENWFSTNGLSKEGIRTLAKLDSDRNDLMVKQSTILAAIETIPSGAYALKDNKGNYIMSADGLTVQYFMPSIASANDKYNYFSGNYTIDGKTVDTGKQVFVQELNKLNNQTLNSWYGNLSQDDKDKSAIELTSMLSTYMASASNPLHNFAKDIVSENGTGLNYEDVLGGTGKYKDGFYQTEYTVGGKTFAVDYNLTDGSIRVNAKPGVEQSVTNNVIQSETYQDYAAANPTTATLFRVVSGPSGNALGAAITSANPENNTTTLSKAKATEEGFNTLLYKTYNTNKSVKEEIYGKLVNGNMYIVKVKP